MVRVNLIEPRKLADQHLIAEYAEILMLAAYIRDYPSDENIPPKYCLCKGHMRFFKNKLKYLKKRHGLLSKEMRKRGFVPSRKLDISKFPARLRKNWKPNKSDREVIKKRLRYKINLKPSFYRYFGEKKPKKFFLSLLK